MSQSCASSNGLALRRGAGQKIGVTSLEPTSSDDVLPY